MGRKISMFDAHFDLVNREPFDHLLYRNMVLFVSSCWSFISNCLVYLFQIISGYVLRFQIENCCDDSNCDVTRKKEDGIVTAANDSGCFDSIPEDLAFEKSENDGFGEKDASGFVFKFPLKNSEDIRRNIEESDVSDGEENTSSMNIRKYGLLSEKDLIGFVKEPEAAIYRIDDSYINLKSSSFGDNEIPGSEFKDPILLQKDVHQVNSGTEAVHEVPKNSYTDIFCRENESEKSEAASFCEDQLSANEAFIDLEIKSACKKDALDDVKILSEKEIGCSDSDPESIKFCDGFSFDNRIINSNAYNFLPVNDFHGFKYELDTTNRGGTAILMDFDREKAEFFMEGIEQSESSHLQHSRNSDSESVDYNDGFPSIESEIDDYRFINVLDTESMDLNDGSSSVDQINDKKLPNDCVSEKGFFELDSENIDQEDTQLSKELECYSQNSYLSDTESVDSCDGFSSVNKDFCTPDCEPEELHGKETETVDEFQKSEETHLLNPSNSYSDDSNRLDSLLEHDDLIEQLKMELKNVRVIGLPTIYEESEESPSTMTIDDLHPWKIEEMFMKEDPMEELHKFHKSYRERMRKLDILNYQMMHASGFLQLKGPLPFQSLAWRKTSFLPQKLRLRQSWKSADDLSAKFIKEVQSDLEMVYVGQACLSWEFLQWQHGKAHDLWELDPQDYGQYNEVAGEFQQFLVQLQRFLENEPFLQGPRVQNYVQNRCVLRSLIQVPAIREDCLKGKDKRRIKNNAITIGMLTEIIEEAMKTLWEFIKADKYEANAILKGFSRTRPELQDPADSEIMINIQADLQKKEKKLRDLLRTGNCLVKRFQKHQENISDLVLFFSQVDMKLVSRVLKMSRISTDQLVWCHKKLNKITFTNRKIHREPSFSLFPC